MAMRKCKCCGELSLPRATQCSRCGSMHFEWEIAVRHRQIERAVLACIAFAAAGAVSTLVGHSMIHTGTGPHTWACVLLIGGIGFVTLSAMVLAVLALFEKP